MVSQLNPQRRYERVEWLAQRLGLSEDSTYYAIRTGAIGGGILKLGRRILIDVDKFEEWASSKTL